MIATTKGPKKSILVVDDSITARTLERYILESAGYEVTLAGNGREAWEALVKNDFSLVISDIRMPDMDGLELTRRIKHSEKHKDVPVILVTSLDSREDKERGIEAGANAYIVKNGMDQARLLAAVKQALG